MTPRRTFVMVIFATLALGACARVKPWQRELLAKPTMALEREDRERTLDRTIDKTQYEGAMGGGTTEGSGCGCN